MDNVSENQHSPHSVYNSTFRRLTRNLNIVNSKIFNRDFWNTNCLFIVLKYIICSAFIPLKRRVYNQSVVVRAIPKIAIVRGSILHEQTVVAPGGTANQSLLVLGGRSAARRQVMTRLCDTWQRLLYHWNKHNTPSTTHSSMFYSVFRRFVSAIIG